MQRLRSTTSSVQYIYVTCSLMVYEMIRELFDFNSVWYYVFKVVVNVSQFSCLEYEMLITISSV